VRGFVFTRPGEEQKGYNSARQTGRKQTL
jgi:hypothetical protein